MRHIANDFSAPSDHAHCQLPVKGGWAYDILSPHVADIVKEVFAQKAKDDSEPGVTKHAVAVQCLVDFAS